MKVIILLCSLFLLSCSGCTATDQQIKIAAAAERTACVAAILTCQLGKTLDPSHTEWDKCMIVAKPFCEVTPTLLKLWTTTLQTD